MDKNRIAKKGQPSKKFEEEFFNGVISGENLLSDMIRLGLGLCYNVG